MKHLVRIVLAFLLLGISTVPGVLAGGEAIKIGMIDAYSGPASAYCIEVRDGFQLALQEINAGGGVLGKQVAVITRDDKNDADLALRAAEELVTRENVVILSGTARSAVSLAVSELAEKARIPLLVTFGKMATITEAKGHRYAFSMNENTSMIGRATAVALAKRPYIRYWIAGDDYAFGHAIADATWTELKRLKPDVQLIGETWWKVGEPDLTPYLSSILGAKPDAVIGTVGRLSCALFLKAAKTTALHDRIRLVVPMASELSTLTSLGMSAPEDVLVASP